MTVVFHRPAHRVSTGHRGWPAAVHSGCAAPTAEL